MVKCPSYVVCYVGIDGIHLSTEPSITGFILVSAINDFSKTYSLHSTGVNKDRYNELCQKHNDLSYNQKRSILPPLDIESVTYNDCDFLEIVVTSDRDFDKSHPAGESLSDIVRFMSWSPYRYILSGYSEYYIHDNSNVSDAFNTIMRSYADSSYFDPSIKETLFPIDKLVKDLTKDDLVLIGGDAVHSSVGIFYFESVPDIKGEYNIAISFRGDNGKVFSDSITLVF